MIKKSFKKKTSVLPKFFTKKDITVFKRGYHFKLYNKFGAHLKTSKGKKGVYFTVWAPNAKSISVVGDFNKWNPEAHSLSLREDNSGVWEGFVSGVKKGDGYKYNIIGAKNKKGALKSDPVSFGYDYCNYFNSKICNLKYTWNDQKWMKNRSKKNSVNQPISIYEMHLGSWGAHSQEDRRFQSYREVAESLVLYLKKMNFTHVEFMPLTEHPYYGSWGYQSLGFFAPTSRFGSAQDLMYLIDCLHQNNIGVILDWVPSHFPADKNGLANFDGTKLYETGELHPDWGSCLFDVGRNQVQNFLLSSVLFWLDKFHIDGIRVDAVASMLYRDYSRHKDQWEPNFFGGVENLESIAFLRKLNHVVKQNYPDCLMIAEESTIWANVSKSTDLGGLDFDFKWNLGWMHDSLKYFQADQKARKSIINQITHCFNYAFSENFLLPLSHDEVVHEKCSLFNKMSGKNDREKFANLKCLYGYMFAHPGKKLLFMGSEIAQRNEWNHDFHLDWELLEKNEHQGVQNWVRDLNRVYKKEKALHSLDCSSDGFEWLDGKYQKQGIVIFLRKGKKKAEQCLIICHFKSKKLHKKKLQLPISGRWKEILNSDDLKYDGNQLINPKIKIEVGKGKENTLIVDLPALSVIFLKKL